MSIAARGWVLAFTGQGLAGIVAASMLVQAAEAQTPALVLSNRTTQAGLTAVHGSGPPFHDVPEMFAGIAVGDFDRDGWQDIFVAGGPLGQDRLYMNNHDGTFTDRAAQWGVQRSHFGGGVAVGDYNGDGWLDIFVTAGPADASVCSHILYRNNGNGTFSDVALEAGVRQTSGGGFDGFGAAWGDYNLDGRLDLAVAGWRYGFNGNKLFRATAGGTFVNDTGALNTSMSLVLGFTPVFVDMDGDRRPDLVWTSDFASSRYFKNLGGGAFQNSTSASGVGLEGNGMGMCVGDFDNDGRPDFYVTSIYTIAQARPGVPGTGNMLYRNMGNHVFAEVGQAAGVRQCGWAWGTVAADLRNVGRQDIVVTNGWPGTTYGTEFLNDPSVVLQNNGNWTFTQVSPGCGMTDTGQGRGALTLDYDNDGFPDILLSTNNGPLILYHNDTPHTEANHWLRVFLNTRASSGIAPDGLGAHVIIENRLHERQHRWIVGASSFLSQSELSAHFGLGTSTEVTVSVEWPGGGTTVRRFVAADQTITIGVCDADWNADGVVGVADIFDYINEWFRGLPRGSVTALGTSIEDIFAFLNRWLTGC